MKQSHICASDQETRALAESLAKNLRGGEIFALIGDLGGGKTTFVKGLAAGLGSPSTVTSPTFNLVHRYPGRIQVIHYDLYRLKKLQEIEELDLEIEMQTPSILAIEWPQLVETILPIHRTWRVEFEEVPEGRKITIQRPSEP